MSDLTSDDEPTPVIKAVDLDIRWADDELAMTDFFIDIENLIDNPPEHFDETTPVLLRQLLDAINLAWTAAGATREADK